MIATCPWCHQLMAGTSCRPYRILVHGVAKPRQRWGFAEGWDVPERCHDCGVTTGGYHHAQCALDWCEHGQLTYCETCVVETAVLS